MEIIVTGGSGFIGGHLLKSLQEKGHNVVSVDISSGIDVCDWHQIEKISGFDVVIHLANKIFVPDSYKDPLDFYHTNIVSTLNLLELCRVNKAKFIYLSSYVYGVPEYLPIDETHSVKPFNPYAESKVICEQICHGYSRDFHVPVIIFRPFNIYGPHQNEIFLIPKMISQARTGKIVIKDVRPRRDYIHIYDVVEAIGLALEYQPENNYEIFNLGFGSSYSVQEVGDIIISLSDNMVIFESENEIRQNEVLDTIACIKKAKHKLNWHPKIDIAWGLAEMMGKSCKE